MTLEDDIRRLAAHAAAHGEPDVVREAAALTGGLPVYSDMGGTLVVSPSREVLVYDHDTRSVKPEDDARWRTLARAKAAKRFPELAELSPVRPHNAMDCTACDGRGVILDSADCGVCMSLGWVEG
jgi:hypothetical protein